MGQIKTTFIIDLYDKYNTNDKAAARYIFRFHDRVWAIKEYEVVDGQLMRPLTIFENEDANQYFQQYASLNEAMSFIQQMRAV